jgi:hypothetical protein
MLKATSHTLHAASQKAKAERQKLQATSHKQKRKTL